MIQSLRAHYLILLSFISCPTLLLAARPSDISHPRLLFTTAMEKQVAESISNDPLAAELQQSILLRAEKIITQRTCRFEKSDGKRLLPESRTAVNNVLHSAWAWRTTKDQRFYDRTLLEMNAICAMNSWNPDHFLDTAEMSTALAIGYDWLYPALKAEQRNFFAANLLEKGLTPIKGSKQKWWVDAYNNWTQVCSTGMAFAAIALDEKEPALCAEILVQTTKSISLSEKFYQPDGAYPEGPGYWHYGTNYHILHLAATQVWEEKMTTPAILEKSGDFILNIVGPSGDCFNYADSSAHRQYITAAQSWIARAFPHNNQAQIIRTALHEDIKRINSTSAGSDARFHALNLLWLPVAHQNKTDPAKYSSFRGEQAIALARTSWKKNAAWIAIKGGSGAASHGHLDVGSFVYEANGERWFCDIGSDNYNLPDYFGKKRWNYLRLNNRSHNTLVINDQLQSTPDEGCPITSWTVDSSYLRCRIDMSTAYKNQVADAQRTLQFHQQTGEVRLSDQLSKATGPVRWAVVTKAKIAFHDKKVTLTQNGKTLTLNRVDNLGGKWQEFSLASQLADEKTNEDYRILGFTVPAEDTMNIVVDWSIDQK